MANSAAELGLTATYQEYGHPGHADVVKGYGALKGILAALLAGRVILIPIHARRVRWFIQVQQFGLLCKNVKFTDVKTERESE